MIFQYIFVMVFFIQGGFGEKAEDCELKDLPGTVSKEFNKVAKLEILPRRGNWSTTIAISLPSSCSCLLDLSVTQEETKMQITCSNEVLFNTTRIDPFRTSKRSLSLFFSIDNFGSQSILDVVLKAEDYSEAANISFPGPIEPLLLHCSSDNDLQVVYNCLQEECYIKPSKISHAVFKNTLYFRPSKNFTKLTLYEPRFEHLRLIDLSPEVFGEGEKWYKVSLNKWNQVLVDDVIVNSTKSSFTYIPEIQGFDAEVFEEGEFTWCDPESWSREGVKFLPFRIPETDYTTSIYTLASLFLANIIICFVFFVSICVKINQKQAAAPPLLPYSQLRLLRPLRPLPSLPRLSERVSTNDSSSDHTYESLHPHEDFNNMSAYTGWNPFYRSLSLYRYREILE